MKGFQVPEASSYSTVQAVWKDFLALAQEMRAASEDRTYTDVERKKYTGMLNRLTSTGLVTDLATMRDVLHSRLIWTAEAPVSKLG